MPKVYEDMRDKFKAQGMGDKEAKGKAARIYNAKRGSKPPVTRGESKSGPMGFKKGKKK